MTIYQSLEVIEERLSSRIDNYSEDNLQIIIRVEEYENSFDTVLLLYNGDLLLMDQVYTTTILSIKNAKRNAGELHDMAALCIEDYDFKNVVVDSVIHTVKMPA